VNIEINNMIISIITAISDNNIIGDDNKIPWYLPSDFKYFKEKTLNHTIIMGRKTFESIGKKLPNRKNIIITSDLNYKADGCVICHSLDEAIEMSKNEDEIFIIGGSQIYKQSLNIADKLYITRVHGEFSGNITFPDYQKEEWTLISSDFIKSDEKNVYDMTFEIYI